MDLQILPITTSTVSSANQTAIPALVRKSLGVQSGDRIVWEVDTAKSRAYVKPVPKDWVTYLRGAGRGTYGNPDVYIKELRGQWDRS